MSRRLPPEAFDFYAGAGVGRSYRAVAEKFGVAKKTVVAAAKRDGWQKKLADRDREAAEVARKRAVDEIATMRERHLQIAQFIQSRAIQALRETPIATGAQAARALAIGLEQERLTRGEPTERTAIDIEAVIKREYALFITKRGASNDWDD